MSVRDAPLVWDCGEVANDLNPVLMAGVSFCSTGANALHGANRAQMFYSMERHDLAGAAALHPSARSTQAGAPRWRWRVNVGKFTFNRKSLRFAAVCKYGV